jgi:ubiquinone/menaquinone biosynthesis C-methylase UbiE
MEGVPMPDLKVDADALKREQKKTWDNSAAAWKRWFGKMESATQGVSNRLIELARIGAGNRVLDIATGGGEPAVTVARVVGANGHVTAIDQSPAMLAFGRERAESAALKNIEFVEADAESMTFAAQSFDAVVCRWGFMFMPDLSGTMRKVHRVLNPGGHLATAVWSTADKMPFFSLVVDAIRGIEGVPATPADPLNPLRLADTSILKNALSEAGFSEITFELFTVTFEFASSDQFREIRGDMGAARATMEKLTETQREQVRNRILDGLKKFQTNDGRVVLPNDAILFSARA